ncbi:hypothetical protein AGMMS50239_30380 [Bacteroidia bacterium]|nr:hypothetical protein AGMMS50239_30380 [Bacteroidia bacterium]
MENKLQLNVLGHAFRRRFAYVEKGVYHEMTAPGGAALVQQVLSHHGLTGYELPDDSFRCEYYADNRRLGITEGSVNTPSTNSAAPYTLVWDEGLGDISPVSVPTLWASDKTLPKKETFDKIAGHCLLMLDANVLRNNGAMISKAISWERTAMNLLWQLNNNTRINYLLKSPYILVTFAEDAAVYIETRNGVIGSASMVLTDGKCEGSQREKLGESAQLGDAFAVMVAAASLQFPDIINQTKKLQLTPVLESAKRLYESNYPIINEKNIEDLLVFNEGEDGEALITIPVFPDGNTILPDTWIIANSKGENYIDELAANFIKFGDEALEGKGLPILQIGGLKTIDRFEIESFNNIRNLIVEYANKKFSKGEDITPLSIAVFGSPGSGKSFGVKQIAGSISGNIKTDTVNVAQISNEDELGAAFQKVRDIILEDKLPLVFFDEFDSGELKWLKNFLMPMQDGKFKDTTGEHPLGKCILVFAGGTASTFKNFISPMSSTDEATQKAFKNVKGPDFVSRIKGAIDIAGPNRKNDSDHVCILRRALLLRSLCERDERLKKNIKDGKKFIDENILRAMLYVTEYKHGARSMETILKMSKIKTGVWLPSDLPMGNQMSVHLNDRKFTDILLIKVIEQSLEGRIARAIHENYVDYMTKKGKQRPNTKPWENLDIEFKLSNLNQARSYHEKLALINCEMALKNENKTPVTSFTENPEDKEVIDEVLIMAKQEHQRWMDEKTEDGWVYAPVRDDRKKHHDCLIEWDKLSKEVQNWDKEPVRNMIGILENVGYEVYRK